MLRVVSVSRRMMRLRITKMTIKTRAVTASTEPRTTASKGKPAYQRQNSILTRCEYCFTRNTFVLTYQLFIDCIEYDNISEYPMCHVLDI